jgi:hypothetical protein
VAVVVLSFVPQTVMPKILQCDIEAIKKLITNLESDPASEHTVEVVQVGLVQGDQIGQISPIGGFFTLGSLLYFMVKFKNKF